MRSVFPKWSDFSVASFGNLLIELYAFVGDVSAFYLDAQARECRLVTATQRKNVIAIARMLGYQLHGAKAATAEVHFELAAPAIAEVTIPAGTIIRTPEVTEPLRFQLLADVNIPASPPGATELPAAIGIVEHSATHTQLVDTQSRPNLDVQLDRRGYLDGSAQVSALTWSRS